KAVPPAKPGKATTEDEMQELRDLLEAQATQLREQNQQLQEEQAQMRLLKEQLMESNGASLNAASAPASSGTAVSSAAIDRSAPTAIGPATGVVTSGANASAADSHASQEFDKNPSQTASIAFKGITLTPGGFMAAETAWRQHALSADVNTPFNAVPFPGSSQNRVSEFNASGRQSRISMLAEGKLSDVKVGGYYEGDFLSAGVTSNSNESNSYTFRQRQFWGQAAFNNGWTFTGGQMWSLVTETKHGVDNRTETTPMTIDAEYNVGFSWARQYGFRVAKDFGNKVWLAMAVEMPETTFAAHGTPANPNFLLGAPGNGGGLYNTLANYSFNAAPDLIFKAAFEPGWGHYEVFAIVSTFRDRVFPCANASATAPCSVDGSTAASAVGAFNSTRGGGGIGANMRGTLFHHVDVGMHFLGGDGIGRYGSGGLPDATVRPDGTLALVRSYQSLGTIEWHSDKWDIYSNVGGEYAARTSYLNSAGKPVGYGAPLFVNSGCWTETVPGASTPAGTTAGVGYIPGGLANCTGDTRNIIEGTLGFWYRFYKGPKGTVQWGPQYSYVVRNTWSGVGTASGVGVSGAPHGIDNMVFTSFRYYLP
ncbi:MAG TPA: hypothetical protein VNE63_09865, partial [Candidatus Acidoferrales bacterium]|nr:hypothetical protein [Candidatus Acidoferrales bacterium]